MDYPLYPSEICTESKRTRTSWIKQPAVSKVCVRCHVTAIHYNRSFQDLGPQTPVSDFVLESFGEKLVPCPPTALYIPLQTHEHIEWSKYTADLRLFVDNKVSVTQFQQAFFNKPN